MTKEVDTPELRRLLREYINGDEESKSRHRNNELHRYCRMIDSYMAQGYSREEAKKFAEGLVKFVRFKE